MKMNTKNIKIIAIIILLLVPTALAIDMKETKRKNDYMIIEINEDSLDKTLFYLLPSDAEYISMKILSHVYEKVSEKTPTTTFYTTDTINAQIDTHIKCTKTKNVYFDIIKKGSFDVARVNVPSIYYSNDYKYTTTLLILEIEYKIKEKVAKELKDINKMNDIIENTNVLDTFATQDISYDPQNPDYEMVIITNETLWPIINSYYKDWKIINDNKINDIWIVNTSDILTTTSFWVNGTYGDATNISQGNSWIPNNKQITSNWELFNDTQAKIRNFLRYCYNVHTTRYVILLGNTNVVPARMIASYAASTCPGCTGFYNNTNHASDMYYSCLDYCMNNNTNSYWMENQLCNNSYDEIDWGYDLHVGRVLVNTVEETFRWINKTKAYVNGLSQGDYLKYNVVATKDVSNVITSQQWDAIGDDFPSNMSFVNDKNITQSQWSILDDYANGDADIDGFSLLIHAGHGGTLWSPYEPSSLNNINKPNFLYTEGCDEGDFGSSTSSRTEQYMQDDGSIFAGVSNSAYGWFIASTYYTEEMMNQMFNATTGNYTLTFCEAHDAAREIVGHDIDCVWGMIVKETNFFGDPSLEYNWYTQSGQESIYFISIDGGSNMTTIYNSTPVFNWSLVNDTMQYNLQISNDSAFTDLVLNLSNISSLNFPLHYSSNATTVSFILPSYCALHYFNKKYYCRVRACTKE